ncbi:blood group Rh(CE) polypeptide isoform X1 [Neopelma chrysocephalum]|uniref:blood group Rh(CE) polypeptide isoform X1 n=2 Tax=Neopelma chrysocephalum TaxID=114329 RepID=UPI000FCD01A7|nr:blood group Rh(CE) polypeptide isoform X1 [Neopelma chrysocephalum]XP_027561710.1 blood group Rh(CE) polypeptide isoform X1 [Neopelma chrysocephalum]XP_027561711.1 blood group Rh(CE) polypeptide isoform X1 [Neopelma chrysocephalum]XP_027561713.1 blood group Rh(CE) polypeptide isoform X1 [Neopelma chrysocephalum]
MSSNYLNFRNSVPWVILLLEVLFLTRSYFVNLEHDGLDWLHSSYPDFQDVNHMVIFGFGFFLMVLRRYGFSSTGFNLLIIVLGVQFSVLVEDSLVFFSLEANEGILKSIAKAFISMTAVVISTGAVLGKTNLMQLIVMTLVELIVFYVSRWINRRYLEIGDHLSLMHVHLFGAYFGLAVTSCFPEPSPRLDKNRSTPKSDLFSMLGCVFLWVFWPSFNSLLTQSGRKAALNTYFALAVSAVTAFMLSALTSKDGKFRMTHIHSAALAGGVIVSFTAEVISHPWIAMILGLLGSAITILGSHCLQRCLNPPLKIHDTSGVHFTFGLPAVLGALAQVVLLVIREWANSSSLGYLVLLHIGAFCQTISLALITGFITGFILNTRLLKIIPVSKYFEDQFYWEFPHLAVGF